jgi:hypothetical protein
MLEEPMISIQALINRMLKSRNKELRQLAKESEEALEKVHRHLLENDREIAALKEQLAETEQAKWIPLAESVPMNCAKVLISFQSAGGVNCQAVAWFDRGLWWLNAKHALDRMYEPVHYWMSLPDDPK